MLGLGSSAVADADGADHPLIAEDRDAPTYEVKLAAYE